MAESATWIKTEKTYYGGNANTMERYTSGAGVLIPSGAITVSQGAHAYRVIGNDFSQVEFYTFDKRSNIGVPALIYRHKPRFITEAGLDIDDYFYCYKSSNNTWWYVTGRGIDWYYTPSEGNNLTKLQPLQTKIKTAIKSGFSIAEIAIFVGLITGLSTIYGNLKK